MKKFSMLLLLAPALAFAATTEPPRPLWICNGILVRIAGPTSAAVGSQIRYEIQIFNEGTCDLTQARITNYIPRGTTYRSATPSPTDVSSPTPASPSTAAATPPPFAPIPQIQWQNVHLAPGGSANEFETEIQVGGTANRMMTNTVCVEHPNVGRVCQALETYVTP